MGLPEILAAAMLGSLALYAMLGGADFGGGIWDLLASGPRARPQRALIERAIAPVWEANHVWLILIVVILFTAFPAAFSAASIALHVPLTLVLVGIVFRGAAFAFLKYDERGRRYERRWTRLFGLSSIVTPFFLGVSLGAIATGRLAAAQTAGGGFADRFVLPWLHALPLAVGVLASCLCAMLAAVYLAVEAEDAALRGDFRKRALAAGGASVLPAAGAAIAAAVAEPARFREIAAAPPTWILLAAALAAWASAAHLLVAKRDRGARVAAVVLVLLMVGGFGLWQYPFLIRPDLTIRVTAAPDAALKPVAIALALGAVVLFPSIIWLLRVFKGPAVFGKEAGDGNRPE